MPRTSASAVSNIFDTDLSDGQLDDWIEIANTLVDDIESADSSISSTRLTQIEKLLAAHMAAAQDQRIASASRESASVSYQGETGMNLRGTKYGQQAIQLDPTTTLSSLGKPAASFSTPNVNRQE